MLNLLKTLRYFIFGVFVICNAIITSVAVWNLGIVQSIASDDILKRIDSYLIFVGALGLFLIFTIIFFEIHGRNVVFVRVWFELSWTGLFCLMEFVGAALITAQSNSQTCDAQTTTTASSTTSVQPATASASDSPCASSEVLQAFTWICATLLLGYFTVLSILTIARRKDDPTIWNCAVRRFPVVMNNYHVSKSPSPTPLPRFAGEQSGVPIIAAPVPRRVAIIREPILSYRSELSQEYEIEHYQSPESQMFQGGPVSDHHGQFMATTTQIAAQPIMMTEANSHQRSQSMSHRIPRQSEMNTSPITPSPFYHTSVLTALGQQSQAQVQTQQQTQQQQTQTQLRPVRPLPVAHVDKVVRRLPPSPPSPPPLGNWPRQDSTAETTTRSTSRVKRKPLPQPSTQVEPQPQQMQRTSSSHYSSRRQQQELPVTLTTSGDVPPAGGSQARPRSRRSSRVLQQEMPPNSTSTSNPAPTSDARHQSRRSSRVLQQEVSTSTTNPSHGQPPASEAQHQHRRSSRVLQQELPPINTSNTTADQAPASHARHQSESRKLRPLPPPRPSPASYELDPSELAAALQPFAETPVSPRTKMRPFGPRRKSNSIDDGRTASADVNLSKMPSFRSMGFR